MTERFWPFDAGSGDEVAEDQWAAMFEEWAPIGVYGSRLGGSSLRVSADNTGRNVKVEPGAAGALGFYYLNDATLTFDGFEPNSSGLPRIDRVVARLDRGANSFRVGVVTGTAAASPRAPGLKRGEGGVWELRLAQVTVPAGNASFPASAVLDDREWAGTLVGRLSELQQDAAGMPVSMLKAGALYVVTGDQARGGSQLRVMAVQESGNSERVYPAPPPDWQVFAYSNGSSDYGTSYPARWVDRTRWDGKVHLTGAIRIRSLGLPDTGRIATLPGRADLAPRGHATFTVWNNDVPYRIRVSPDGASTGLFVDDGRGLPANGAITLNQVSWFPAA